MICLYLEYLSILLANLTLLSDGLIERKAVIFEKGSIDTVFCLDKLICLIE